MYWPLAMKKSGLERVWEFVTRVPSSLGLLQVYVMIDETGPSLKPPNNRISLFDIWMQPVSNCGDGNLMFNIYHEFYPFESLSIVVVGWN